MIPFNGRISFRQFLPAKRIRFGIKAFVLAESETSYISNFHFYVGEETQDRTLEHCGKSGQVVMKLMQPFLAEGYHVYMDNTSQHTRKIESCPKSWGDCSTNFQIQIYMHGL